PAHAQRIGRRRLPRTAPRPPRLLRGHASADHRGPRARLPARALDARVERLQRAGRRHPRPAVLVRAPLRVAEHDRCARRVPRRVPALTRPRPALRDDRRPGHLRRDRRAGPVAGGAELPVVRAAAPGAPDGAADPRGGRRVPVHPVRTRAPPPLDRTAGRGRPGNRARRAPRSRGSHRCRRADDHDDGARGSRPPPLLRARRRGVRPLPHRAGRLIRVDLDTYRALGLDRSLVDDGLTSSFNGRSFFDDVTRSTSDPGDAPYAPCPEAFPAAGTPRGRVEHVPGWQSSACYPGTTRDIWVYASAGLDAATDAPALMVFNDGGTYVADDGAMRVPAVLDSLVHAGELPPTMAVFVQAGRPEGADGGMGDLATFRQRSVEYDTCRSEE